MALDALDFYVDECHRTEELVYGVRLFRTHQLRNDVPLHHLRWPLKAGRVVEVCDTSKTKRRPYCLQWTVSTRVS